MKVTSLVPVLLLALASCALMPEPPAGTGWQCLSEIDGAHCDRTCLPNRPCQAQDQAWCYADQEPTNVGCYGNHGDCVTAADRLGNLASACYEFH